MQGSDSVQSAWMAGVQVAAELHFAGRRRNVNRNTVLRTGKSWTTSDPVHPSSAPCATRCARCITATVPRIPTSSGCGASSGTTAGAIRRRWPNRRSRRFSATWRSIDMSRRTRRRRRSTPWSSSTVMCFDGPSARFRASSGLPRDSESRSGVSSRHIRVPARMWKLSVVVPPC